MVDVLELREADDRLRRLTDREMEVITRVSFGRSNREIGSELSISPRTVEIHRASAIVKMAAWNTADASRIITEARLAAQAVANG